MATTGYYSVQLNDANINAEFTVATHSDTMRFTFPANQKSRIQIVLARRGGRTSILHILQNVKVIADLPNLFDKTTENMILDATLNGQSYPYCFISQTDIANGGALDLQMGFSQIKVEERNQ